MDTPSNLRVRLMADLENSPSKLLASTDHDHSPSESASAARSALHNILSGRFKHRDQHHPNNMDGVKNSAYNTRPQLRSTVDQPPAEEGFSRSDCTESLVWLSPDRLTLVKKMLSEFMGTFVLVLVAAGVGVVNEVTGGSLTLLGCATAGGLAVMAVIFSIGHVSGAHINPSVTLAFASLCQLPWIEVPSYITGQVLGAITASYALKAIFHSNMQSGMTLPQAGYTESFILESLISCILMFVITSVTTDTRAYSHFAELRKELGEMTAIAVGMTVLFNALLAGEISGGSMNPARSIGPAVAANNYTGLWLYIVAPTLGMQVGAGAYTLIRTEDPNNLPAKPSRSNISLWVAG